MPVPAVRTAFMSSMPQRQNNSLFHNAKVGFNPYIENSLFNFREDLTALFVKKNIKFIEHLAVSHWNVCDFSQNDTLTCFYFSCFSFFPFWMVICVTLQPGITISLVFLRPLHLTIFLPDDIRRATDELPDAGDPVLATNWTFIFSLFTIWYCFRRYINPFCWIFFVDFVDFSYPISIALNSGQCNFSPCWILIGQFKFQAHQTYASFDKNKLRLQIMFTV